MRTSDAVRADLEHQPHRKPPDTGDRPRRPFSDIDEAACTAALAAEFGEAGYLFPGRDGRGTWWAFRIDGQAAPSGRWPDELRVNILADLAANPVSPR